MEDGERTPAAAEILRVRCLQCREVYEKPAAGGAVERNPGCPECGYVGWVPVSAGGEAEGPSRYGADPPPRLVPRWR